jgi:mycothiol synthase
VTRSLPDTFGEADVRVEVLRRLDPAEIDRVAVLVERATENDGVRPLSEHVMLHLRHGGDDSAGNSARNVLLYVDRDQLAGYAHIDNGLTAADAAQSPVAELVVDPALRGHGLGRLLVGHVQAEEPGRRIRLWSHGEHPAALALAKSLGFDRARALWQMRRPLGTPLAEPALPPGVRIRTFLPGADDEAWADLNARAFADHPEQGGVGIDGLHQRMEQPWFDPNGFFLAVRDDAGDHGRERLVGFHWTKVHGGSGPPAADLTSAAAASTAHGHDPIGEVYVVGVDPAEQGRGLGRALTLVGLAYLRGLGLTEVMLYVDATNAAAIRVYTNLGFVHWDTDVTFES